MDRFFAKAKAKGKGKALVQRLDSAELNGKDVLMRSQQFSSACITHGKGVLMRWQMAMLSVCDRDPHPALSAPPTLPHSAGVT